MNLGLLTRPSRVVDGASDAAPVFGAPIDITDALISSRGSAVFDGLWIENTSYSSNNGAAIYVTTSQAITIQNCVLKAQQRCISSLTNNSNITVRNNLLLSRNTTQTGQPPGRNVNLYQPGTIVVENNTIIGGGILMQAAPSGPGTTARIRYNRMLNVDGRLSDGAGGFILERANVTSTYFLPRQFVQVNIGTFVDADISWNEVINDPFISRPEDTINMSGAVGLVGQYFNIHDNYIQGSGPSRPYDIGYSGGGIVVEGAAQYINIDDNQIVGYNNIGGGIAGGDNINVRRNRFVSVGRVNGRAMLGRNRAWVSLDGSSTYIVHTDNAWAWIGQSGNQSDGGFYITNSGNTGNSETGTTSISASPTEATEVAEWAIWQAKVLAAGVTIGSSLAP